MKNGDASGIGFENVPGLLAAGSRFARFDREAFKRKVERVIDDIEAVAKNGDRTFRREQIREPYLRLMHMITERATGQDREGVEYAVSAFEKRLTRYGLGLSFATIHDITSMYRLSGESKEALRWCEKLFDHAKSEKEKRSLYLPYAYSERGMVYACIEEYAKAEDDLKKALELARGSDADKDLYHFTSYHLGHVYFSLGRLDEARAVVEEYFFKGPSKRRRDDIVLLADIYVRLGMENKGLSQCALDMAEALVSLDPEDPRAYITLAASYRAVGDHRASLDVILKGVEKGLSGDKLFLVASDNCNVGSQLIAEGRIEEAERFFEDAIAWSTRARDRLARSNGDAFDAFTAFHHFIHARIALIQGRYADAIKFVELAKSEVAKSERLGDESREAFGNLTDYAMALAQLLNGDSGKARAYIGTLFAPRRKDEAHILRCIDSHFDHPMLINGKNAQLIMAKELALAACDAATDEGIAENILDFLRAIKSKTGSTILKDFVRECFSRRNGTNKAKDMEKRLKAAVKVIAGIEGIGSIDFMKGCLRLKGSSKEEERIRKALKDLLSGLEFELRRQCEQVGQEGRAYPEEIVLGYLERATGYFREGDYDGAKNEAEFGLSVTPEKGMPDLRGRFDKVIGDSKTAADYSQQAKRSYASGDIEEAKRFSGAVLALNPEDAQAKELKRQTGLIEEAEDAYQKGDDERARSLISAIDNKRAKRLLGNIEKLKQAQGAFDNGDFEEAHKLVDSVLSQNPDDVRASELEGKITAKKAELLKFIGMCETGIARMNYKTIVNGANGIFGLIPKSPMAMGYLIRGAKAFYEAGQFEDAENLACEVLKQDPGNKEASLIKKRVYAQGVLARLKAHHVVIDTIVRAQAHRYMRLKHENDSPVWTYERLETDPLNLRAGGSFRVTGIKGANEKNRDKFPWQIGKRGEAFQIYKGSSYDREGDLFTVAESDDTAITFHIETQDQLSVVRGLISYKGRGAIRKVEDTSLLRQRDAVEDAMDQLEDSLRREGKPTTSNKLIDAALGLAPAAGNSVNGSAKEIAPFNQTIVNDPSQKAAIYSALDLAQLITFIQGPPGTGKTTVIEEVARQFAERRGRRVLVLSQAHAGVDNVGKRLKKKGVLFSRFASKLAQEKMDPELDDIWERRRQFLEEARQGWMKRSKGFICLGTINGFLNDTFIRGYPFFNEFDVVIIEEAGHATLAEWLVAIGMAREKVVGIGDHKQLPPSKIKDTLIELVKEEAGVATFRLPAPVYEIFSRRNKDDFCMSLFEEGFGLEEGAHNHMLKIGRRSHRVITELVSEATYDGKLIPADKSQIPEDDTIRIVDIGHNSDRQPKGSTSHWNPDEVKAVLDEVDRVLNLKDKEDATRYRYELWDILIITPYRAQMEPLRSAFIIKAVLNDLKDGVALDADKAPFFIGALRQWKKIEVSDQHIEGLVEDLQKKQGTSESEAAIRKIQEALLYPGIISRSRREGRSLSYADISEIEMMEKEEKEEGGGGAVRYRKKTLKIATVDASQGTENKVVIVSFVRSNEKKEVGFMANRDGRKRLNVAISRAQQKLILVGDFSGTLLEVRPRRGSRRKDEEGNIEAARRMFRCMWDSAKRVAAEAAASNSGDTTLNSAADCLEKSGDIRGSL